MINEPINSTTPLIREKAPLILEAVKKASSILLHCHPAPDPDSVGSALSMKFALEQLGKKATVIQGDTPVPRSFMHFPGAEQIVPQDFFQTDLSKFDLFMVLDGGGLQMISRKGEVVFPSGLDVVVIDHHRTNAQFGRINLVETSYPANCQVLFDLFIEWGIRLTPEIASNLFMGIYTDTGAFKYAGVSAHTFEIAARLAPLIADLPVLVSTMQNGNSPGFLAFQGTAFKSIQTYCGGIFAIARVTYAEIQAGAHGAAFGPEDLRSSDVSSYMRTVPEWQITACAIETAPGTTKFSFRAGSKNSFDVSKLAAALGGGGHMYAAGLILAMPLEAAIDAVVAKAKELYNL